MIENVTLKSIQHNGLTIEGYSRAAVQTFWRVPELKLGFDHAAALPVYVARRRMMKMEPPDIYLPAYSVEGVERLLRSWQRLDRGRMPCQLVGVEPGQEIELSREHCVSVFATKHTLPSVGFLVWERRRKLRSEYHGLPGEKIRELRLAGVDVTKEVRMPLVAYLGDSSPEGLDGFPPVYEARILIMELTFVAPSHRKEKIHKFGHMHLDDVVERVDRFQNDLIIASHFSTRYHAKQIRYWVERSLPNSLTERLMLWL
jgi:ribonuclease Z